MNDAHDSPSRLREAGKYAAKVFLVGYLYFYFAKFTGFDDPTSANGPNAGFHLYGGALLASAAAAFYGPAAVLPGAALGEVLLQWSHFRMVWWAWVAPTLPYALVPAVPRYSKGKYGQGTHLVNLGVKGLASSSTSTLMACWAWNFTGGAWNEAVAFAFLTRWLGSFVSAFLLAPFLALFYEWLTRPEVRYHEVLTHHPPLAADHSFPVELNGCSVYFCSRCGGMMVGLFMTFFAANLLPIRPPQEFIVWACALAPIPGMVDWGTQRLGFRTSNTTGRLVTGTSIGVAMYFLSLVDADHRAQVLAIVVVYFVAFFFLFVFGDRIARSLAERRGVALKTEEGDDFTG
ncbi:MAG: hypothetical protein Kow0069_23280 [Promethearchaeota archaeon]